MSGQLEGSEKSITVESRTFRKWLSRKRALAKCLLGSDAGFFSQYDFMNSVAPPVIYPDIARHCEEADVQRILTELTIHDSNFAADPFWLKSTRHLGAFDSIVDYAVVRAFRPAQILEIGCGRSTQVLARALRDNCFGTITCIDPAPRLDVSGLPINLLKRALRVDDVGVASSLEPNDVLFIDSSHILQPGTDVDLELNIILPSLRPGVLVHVHDIFLPWGYPVDWRARNWNEACGLIPWISSGAMEVFFPSYFLVREREGVLRDALPQSFSAACEEAPGSFWMKKKC